MAQVKQSVLAALIAAGITAQTPEADIKKAYFKASRGPLSKDMLPVVIAALGGDATAVKADDAASTPAPKAEKAPKADAAPRVAKAAETGEQALARLKADPATSARWARVQSVLEMGKRGPVRVRIICDDKGAQGEDLFRDIKVQDLFQVKFSEGYQKRNRKKAAAPVVAPTEQAAPAAETVTA